MVREGVGYAITLDKLADTGDGSGLCFRPLMPKVEAGLNVVWKRAGIFGGGEDFSRRIEIAIREIGFSARLAARRGIPPARARLSRLPFAGKWNIDARERLFAVVFP